MSKSRDVWVDNVKVVACVLIVLGHFFQRMTKAYVLPANDSLGWFDQTIYYFHVPLFFICSDFFRHSILTPNITILVFVYAIFHLFLVTPTFKGVRTAVVGLVAAIILKIVRRD